MPAPRRSRVAPQQPAASARADEGDKPGKPNKPSLLDRLGLRSDWELALHLPLRFEDHTRLTPLAALRDGDVATVDVIVQLAEIYGRPPRRQLLVRTREAPPPGNAAAPGLAPKGGEPADEPKSGHGAMRPSLAVDAPGAELTLRLFHFYPNQQRQLQPGARLRVHGAARRGLYGWEMVHSQWRPIDADEPLPTTLTPVYPAAANVPQAYLRKAIATALARLTLDDTLRPEELAALQLPPLAASLQLLHAPPPAAAAALDEGDHPAQRRLRFDELLAQQLAQQHARLQRQRWRAPMLDPTAAAASGQRADADLVPRLHARLPFALTAAQQRCVEEIASELQRPQPMHRLLQGDVGSGKTVVAALAAAQCIAAGWQCVIMAPTEVLAGQHARKLAEWLLPLGVQVAWLAGSQSKREREQARAAAASGAAQLIVGTHAVIQDGVRFARLGLAVVDEQHRFGVAQRLALRDALRAGLGETDLQPHLLMMSATPIPRTLAMALFGDLDVSTLDELPPGRTPVRTRVFSAERRAAVIARLGELLARGRQAYWVCPLVEESEALDLQNAIAVHAELTAELAAQAQAAGRASPRVGLLHGRMKPADKQATLQAFAAGDLALLVATTVIEVGVDVPNASLMVIEHAERFGLSQLHQLRGRVGRGRAESECLLLFTSPLSPTAQARLTALRDSSDGFALAQKDLELRGPGELLGLRQSGVPALRYADLVRDADLIDPARELAQRLWQSDPARARAHVQRWLGGAVDWLGA